DKVMAAASQEYQNTDRGKISDWFTKPDEVQIIRNELYPSWYDQKQAQAGEDMTFDKVSKKKATECTPEAAKIVIKVVKMTDPITKNTVYTNTEGYNANADDDV